MSETESECCRADPLGREPCDAIMDADKEIDSLRAEVERLTKERDAAVEKFNFACEDAGRTERTLHKTLEDRERLLASLLKAEKSRDEAIAELNKALETIGQLRVERNELETALGKASNLATSANQRLFDKEKEVSSLTETLGQLRRALSNTVLLRDSWRETCGSVIADTASELGCDADNEEILFAITRLKTRAQSAEDSLAKLREAAAETVRLYDAIEYHQDEVYGRDEFEVHVDTILRSLLDEPDKGGKDGTN